MLDRSIVADFDAGFAGSATGPAAAESLSVLAACTTIAKVDGEQVVGGKLAVTLPQAWNKVTDPWERGRYDMWTREGIPLDHLRLWAGLRPGESLVAKPTVLFRAPGEAVVRSARIKR